MDRRIGAVVGGAVGSFHISAHALASGIALHVTSPGKGSRQGSSFSLIGRWTIQDDSGRLYPTTRIAA